MQLNTPNKKGWFNVFDTLRMEVKKAPADKLLDMLDSFAMMDYECDRNYMVSTDSFFEIMKIIRQELDNRECAGIS